uniref:Uncharacterized protein n=1 Tax=Anguilla anguilla TaxID=7936 RepID=A0A0E9RG62_ANGAN
MKAFNCNSSAFPLKAPEVAYSKKQCIFMLIQFKSEAIVVLSKNIFAKLTHE